MSKIHSCSWHYFCFILLPFMTETNLCINVLMWNFSNLLWAKSGISGVITGNFRLNWENLYVCWCICSYFYQRSQWIWHTLNLTEILLNFWNACNTFSGKKVTNSLNFFFSFPEISETKHSHIYHYLKKKYVLWNLKYQTTAYCSSRQLSLPLSTRCKTQQCSCPPIAQKSN